MDEYLIERLRDAIQTMMDACQRADRDLQRLVDGKNSTHEEAINVVLHELSWGSANANSDIETAINYLGRIRETNEIKQN